MRDPDDYFAKVQKAHTLNAMRDAREQDRCRALGITPEMKAAATLEIGVLHEGLLDQPPQEQLRRYERMFELANVRGYFYTIDPGFDVVRMNAVRRHMRELAARVATTDGPEPHS